VPFMFVYSPALLTIGDWTAVAHASLAGLGGIVCLAAGLQGHLVRECRWWERAALVVAACLLIKPGLVTDLLGFGLLALVWGMQRVQARKDAATSTTAVAK
jgi:TRAP-type uncharacterized transport system fused permease subunit